MTAGANVRHRDKRVSRGMAAILGIWGPLSWILAVVICLNNATASQPVSEAALPFVVGGIVAFGFFMLLLALGFAVLRTVVTETEINVKYGLWGPTIPLASIESCSVTEYDWSQFGGWGIRRGLGGKWAYVPGPGEVVEIEYNDDGRIKTVQVGADDARKLMSEINRAREAVGGKRIDVGAADIDAEAEAEALAEAEAEAEAKAEAKAASRS